MKRTAAILGPTPPFVRWAIRHDCPLRQNDVLNLPDATFRQLRGLRELSLARRHSRVVSGVCIHPEFNTEVETARGFFAEEMAQVFGGTKEVQRNCMACPANAVQHSTKVKSDRADDETWAGCYGWFPSKTDTTDFIQLFCESPSCENWYRFWTDQSSFQGIDCEALIEVMNDISTNHGPSQLNSDFHQLYSAAILCRANEMTLEFELIPSGFSDGSNWTIEPHCSACKKEIKVDNNSCSNCGESGTTHPAIKRKVLGLRPYGLLKHLVGPSQTEILLQQFRDQGCDEK